MGTRKVVINDCYGGFGLSHEAIMAYAKRAGITLWCETDEYGNKRYRIVGREETYWYLDCIARDDPHLVAIVEEMGEAADGDYADLKVVEIPDDVDWEINDYDGREWVAEKHRTWS